MTDKPNVVIPAAPPMLVQCLVCGGTNGSHDLTCTNAPYNKDTHGLRVRGFDVHPEVHIPFSKLGEVRTTSSTGGQKGVKPQRMSLLPFGALAKIGEVYGFGEKKYAAHNWRKGYEWDKSIDALERHIGAFKDGEDNDPESGLSHIAHAGFHILTLLTFVLNPLKYKKFDNRYKEEDDGGS